MSSVVLDDDAKFSFVFVEDNDKPEGSSDMKRGWWLLEAWT